MHKVSKSDPVEQRIAKKFGLVYAAGRLAVDAGLLDWPESWPWSAAGHCFRNSLSVMQAESVVLARAVRKLRKNANDQKLFPICSLRVKRVSSCPRPLWALSARTKANPCLGFGTRHLAA